MINSIIKNYLDCRNIQRMSGRIIHRSYDLTQHQYLVGMLFRHFAILDDVPHDINTWDIVLKHDLIETGTMCDLVWPIKNLNSITKRAWEEIEEEVVKANPQLEKYSDKAIKSGLTERQYDLFKACDYLELLLFLKEERLLGNNTVEIGRVIANCYNFIGQRCEKQGFNHLFKFMNSYEL